MREIKLKIDRWGNGYGIRLTKPTVDYMGAQEGATVTAVCDFGTLFVCLVPRYDLEELLARVTVENQHNEDWGDVRDEG